MAKKIISSQLPDSEKENFADYVIVNDGTKQQLEENTIALLNQLEVEL